MAHARLDKHDKIHHELFDEDTNQVGSLGDIVEKHAGDAIFLTPPEKSVGGADGGEDDFEAEMNLTDPAAREDMDPDDLYSATDEEDVFATDQTGTVEGIARGFGTHLPQDVGRGGFQVETIPDRVLNLRRRSLAAGEELDDYDDDASEDNLAADSQPFVHAVSTNSDTADEPTQGRIPVRTRHPDSQDDALDATRQIG